VAENEDLGRFGEHRAAQHKLRVFNSANRIAAIDKLSEEVGLTRHIVVHRDHDRGAHLIDDFKDVFEAEIGHSIDRRHHHIHPLQDLLLFRGQEVTHIAEVGQTEAPHLVDEDRVGDPAPERAALARDIDNDNVSDAGPYRIPSLSQGDSSEDDRIARDRPDIVMRNVVVAHCDRIRRGAGSHVEVWVRDNLGLAPGLDEEA